MCNGSIDQIKAFSVELDNTFKLNSSVNSETDFALVPLDGRQSRPNFTELFAIFYPVVGIAEKITKGTAAGRDECDRLYQRALSCSILAEQEGRFSVRFTVIRLKTQIQIRMTFKVDQFNIF